MGGFFFFFSKQFKKYNPRIPESWLPPLNTTILKKAGKDWGEWGKRSVLKK
jgi:hypothetical protein